MDSLCWTSMPGGPSLSLSGTGILLGPAAGNRRKSLHTGSLFGAAFFYTSVTPVTANIAQPYDNSSSRAPRRARNTSAHDDVRGISIGRRNG